MITTMFLLMSLALTSDSLSPRDLENLVVVRGDLLVADFRGESTTFKIAGIWAPSPPASATTAHYGGEEARDLVDAALKRRDARIELLERDRQHGSVPIRVFVGLAERQDLAVLLAEAGLALEDPASAADFEHASRIRQAERRARRGYRGIHDGGFLPHARAAARLKDLGVELRLRSLISVSRSAYGSRHAAAEGTAFWTKPRTWAHRTPIGSIRDYGASLGLPPDDSSPGR